VVPGVLIVVSLLSAPVHADRLGLTVPQVPNLTSLTLQNSHNTSFPGRIVVVERAPVTLIELTAAQRNTLIALKRRGEASVDDLADALAITPSAARQQLAALRSAGLVATRQQRGRPGHPGRPSFLYHGTHQGEALFAHATGDLSVELLSYIEEEDPNLISRVFERRQHRRVEQVRDQLVGKSIDEKVAALAELLDAEGYMAAFDKLPDESYRVTLCNCAIWPVASLYGAACATELEFLQAVLPEADVERVEHKVAGGRVCEYALGHRSQAPSPSEQARRDMTSA
jgi:predicted ArsR family transcriptional regulator